MKKFLFLLAFIPQVAFAALPATSALPQNGSIVSRWKLDEASGTRADNVGANTLTDHNSTGSSTGPFGDTCANFTRSSSMYLSHVDNASLSITGDMSIFLWVNFATLGLDEGLVCKNTQPSASYTLVNSPNAPDAIRVKIFSDGDANVTGDFAHSMSTGTWYHIGFVYTAAAGSVAFYKNGAQLGSTLTGFNTSIFDGTSDFVIGANSSGVSPLDGKMQDVLLYNRALTSGEITTLYNAYTASSGVSRTYLIDYTWSARTFS